MTKPWLPAVVSAALLLPPFSALGRGDEQPPRDLTELSLAELAALEVTSLARKAEARSLVPAAEQDELARKYLP